VSERKPPVQWPLVGKATHKVLNQLSRIKVPLGPALGVTRVFVLVGGPSPPGPSKIPVCVDLICECNYVAEFPPESPTLPKSQTSVARLTNLVLPFS
jgi:hypothetical protein